MGERGVPRGQLRLEWVYGYRGHQCRNNVYYTASGSIVYFVAGVGVVVDAERKKQSFYLGHSDDIISLALHPEKKLVATGQVGKEGVIHVWDTGTMQTVSIMKGAHSKGVACVHFGGVHSRLLVSCGLEEGHTIVVWEWQKGTQLAAVKGHDDRIFDVQFSPYDNTTIVSCGVKHIRFWNIIGNTLQGKKGVFGKSAEVQTQLCLAFGAKQTTYSGTLGGDIYVWRGNDLQTTIQHAHGGAIFSIHMSPDGYATAGKDGIVRLWDQDFKAITTIDMLETSVGYRDICLRTVCWNGERIMCGTKDSEIFEITVHDKNNPATIAQGHAEGELWGLTTHPSKPFFLTASDDFTVRLWSSESHSMMNMAPTDAEARSAQFTPDGEHVAVGLKSGTVLIMKVPDLSVVHTIKDRKETIHVVKYSPNGAFLAVGGNEGVVDIYTGDKYERAGESSHASSFITHLDFSDDSKSLQANTGIGERMILTVPACKRMKLDAAKDIKWASWTCVLGEEATGIWGKYKDANDVNAADAAGNTMITGDDFGKVKLYKFPAMQKGARFRHYSGHSAHVTNVRFDHTKQRVLTTGGADHSVFQWSFHPDGGFDAEFYHSHDEVEDSEDETLDPEEIDSDVERETQVSYDRDVYTEDLPQLKKQAMDKVANVSRAQPPDDGLLLKFVHGYRGYDCRNNVFVSKGGDIMYHVAAVGIAYDSTKHSQRHYTQHTDDILCLALHPLSDIAATGQIGRDPTIHVWNTSTMATLSILKGHHTRGVCAVDFSPDGQRLVSVGLDDDHTLCVWDWSKGTMLATTRGHKDKIFVVKYNPYVENELVTVGSKHIAFWQQAGAGFTSKRGVFGDKGKLDTMLCVTFRKGGTALSGASNGLVYAWDKNNLVSTHEAHKGPVFAILPVDKGFVTGGKDGRVCLWDEMFSMRFKTYDLTNENVVKGSSPLIQDSPTVRAVALAKGKIFAGTSMGEIVQVDKAGSLTVLAQGHGEGEVWGLATHPTAHGYATVSDDGYLRIWDASNLRLVRARALPAPARAVSWTRDGKQLLVGLKTGALHLYDAATLEEKAKIQHRKEEISDIKSAPDGKLVAVASHDNFVDIYEIAGLKRVGVCKGASSYITHIDWDKSSKIIMVNSGAKELLYFEAPKGTRQPLSASVVEQLDWDSWTCVLGKECSGVWPAHSDVTDVNTLCRSNNKKVLATGDDFGFVKVFTWPSTGQFSKFKKYMGHSAHVTNVRFLFDDSHLISIGGADTSVMVWAYGGVSEAVDQARKDSKTAILAAAGESDCSSTDEEEEGYDSDVARERKIDYTTKTYTTPLREMKGVKPQQNADFEERGEDSKIARGKTEKAKVFRKKKGDGKSFDRLQLEFIHGYRGFDARNNLHYLQDGKIVYHAAGAGIVYDTESSNQTFYLEHTDDIISLTVNRNPKFQNIVASGQIGKKATVNIWDAASLETQSILVGTHSIGVCALSFSANGRLLLSVGVDENHTVAVHKWSQGTLVSSTEGGHSRIFVAEFRPDSDSEFVTVGVKHIKFWSLVGSTLIAKRGIIPRGRKMTSMLAVAFGEKGVTYSAAMNGEIWAWSNNQLMRVVTAAEGAHVGAVSTMYTYQGTKGSQVLSAGKDGLVKVWDSELKKNKSFQIKDRNVRSVCRGSGGKILVGTESAEIFEIVGSEKPKRLISGHEEGELWGLDTHPSAAVFATTSDDKTLRVWDIASKSCTASVTLSFPGRSVTYSRNGALLAVGMQNGAFAVFESVTLKKVFEKRDRKTCIQDIKFSPNDKLLAVASDDEWIDIYSVEKQWNREGYCKGVGAFVSHLDWSEDSQVLQVDTGNYQKKYYEVPSGNPLDPKVASKITWATWTSVLGPEVVGIWPKDTAQGDVNCSALAHHGNILATGDDFGFVKTFDFPVTDKFAKHRKYTGHSAHVTNVRFTSSDTHLISTGGDDCCIFVWKTL